MPPRINRSQPWEIYAVEEDGFLDSDCQDFSLVSHVTHVDNAVGVVKAGALIPRLVEDESKLRTRRILVNWLSPNFWNDGFRYGNVSFDFPFSELIRNKYFYWVEAIKHTPTSPTACRILITTVNRDQSPYLDRYEPQQKNGPWWWHRPSNKHYRNPRYALEFMFEQELALDGCSTIDFVKHHPEQCAIDYRTCVEKGLPADRGGALFIAGVLSQGLGITNHLCSRESRTGKWHAKGERQGAFYFLQAKLARLPYGGDVTAGTSVATALARSLVAALFRKDVKELKVLSQLFASPEDLQGAIKKMVKESFGIDNCFDE